MGLLVPTAVLLAGPAPAGRLLVAVVVARAFPVPAPLALRTTAPLAPATSATAVRTALEVSAVPAPELLLPLAELAFLSVVLVLGELVAVAPALCLSAGDSRTLFTKTPTLLSLMCLRATSPAVTAEDGVAEGATRTRVVGRLPLLVQLALNPRASVRSATRRSGSVRGRRRTESVQAREDAVLAPVQLLPVGVCSRHLIVRAGLVRLQSAKKATDLCEFLVQRGDLTPLGGDVGLVGEEPLAGLVPDSELVLDVLLCGREWRGAEPLLKL